MKLENLEVLKIYLNYKKNGVLQLRLCADDSIITKAGGYGYDKTGAVFKQLFLRLGFDVKNICYTKFDLFHYSLEAANQFLKENQINYKINYLSKINNNIDFIELSKI